MWYVIGLIWVALFAGIVWSYRRKKAQRDAARARQFEGLLVDLKNRGENADAPASPIPTADIPVTEAAPPIPQPEYGRKARFLGQPGALLYYLFRAALPDHEIFASVPLGDAVEIKDSLGGADREQRARRLDQLKLDVVVCNKQLEIIAAAVFSQDETQEPALLDSARFIEECLGSAGIRVIRIDRTALPRHHRVRALVYGRA